MLEQTRHALEERISNLEIDLGVDKLDEEQGSCLSNTVVTKIAELQMKIKNILQPEVFKNVSSVLDEYRAEVDLSLDENRFFKDSSEFISQAEKQERISSRIESIQSCYNVAMELQSLEIPEIPTEFFDALDMSKIVSNSDRIKSLTKYYELMVLRTLILTRKFEDSANRESMFWANVNERLSRMNMDVLTISRQDEIV